MSILRLLRKITLAGCEGFVNIFCNYSAIFPGDSDRTRIKSNQKFIARQAIWSENWISQKKRNNIFRTCLKFHFIFSKIDILHHKKCPNVKVIPLGLFTDGNSPILIFSGWNMSVREKEIKCVAWIRNFMLFSWKFILCTINIIQNSRWWPRFNSVKIYASVSHFLRAEWKFCSIFINISTVHHKNCPRLKVIPLSLGPFVAFHYYRYPDSADESQIWSEWL